MSEETLEIVAGSPQFAAQDGLSPQDLSDAKDLIGQLALSKRTWSGTTCRQRIDLLDQTIRSLARVADRWVAASCRAKGHAPGTSASGEEWLAGPCIVARNLRLLRQSLQDIQKYGEPKLPGKVRARSGGGLVAPVFPTGLFDRLLFTGFSAEVWMDPEVSLEQLPKTMAVAYKESRPASICLVLCAGNVSSIGPMDALYKIFVENQVVLLKMNPVNDYLTPILEKALEPLIEAGTLRIVNGGIAMARYLCSSDGIDSIHITGSDKTHDAIVFGAGAEGVRRKQQRQPINSRPITSELGNVSPVIVVPGPWRPGDLRFQAENVASMLINNAGFNCNSARVLITHRQWDQQAEFMDQLERTFARVPTRKAYYPGAALRHEAFTKGREGVVTIGDSTADTLPWTLIRDVDTDDLDEMCYRAESFCSVLAESRLAASSVASFIQHAVEFANDRIWGTLNATLIVHPATCRDSTNRKSVEDAIAKLRYGTVAINHWAGLNFGLGSTTWGAYPGHSADDIQSGKGVVHNTYMFDRSQKTVLRGPFRPFLKPVWFATHRRVHALGPALFQFECAPSWFTLPSVAINAYG
jgi:acyl-CoA reductase-like NAD-dependent aldehyde dehydrogenase